MCLTDLGLDQAGIITSINTATPNVQRLMVMGLVEGSVIKHLSTAGNAYEFEVFSNTIAFSKEEAQHFTVELL
jgi:Fe2+ transport system protein FeoA